MAIASLGEFCVPSLTAVFLNEYTLSPWHFVLLIRVVMIVKPPRVISLCQIPHPPADITEARVPAEVCTHVVHRVLPSDGYTHFQEPIVDLPPVERTFGSRQYVNCRIAYSVGGTLMLWF